jgi:hypothetical protein
LWYNIEKANGGIVMNYKDVILEEYIESYKEEHRIFYSTLSSMIFDISFLEACVALQDRELYSDWITVQFLHRDIFQNLISKVYRCFFDKTSGDTTNILLFKNHVSGTYLKSEYREEIRETLKGLNIFSLEFKPTWMRLEKNIVALRNGFIGHRLLTASDECVVDLKDIRKLVEYAFELHQALSFEPRRFYKFVEGDGYDFSKELAYTEKSTHNFIAHTFLTSKHIKKINCEFDEDCPKDIKDRLEAIIQTLNNDR